MSEPERETLEFDVQFIGAGPAGLAGAIHLANLIERHNQSIAAAARGCAIAQRSIAVFENSATVGAHASSGAVLDPRALRELMPDYRDQGCPIASEVAREELRFLTSDTSFTFPILPPMFENHGNHVISLGNFVAWLAEKAEAKGVL